MYSMIGTHAHYLVLDRKLNNMDRISIQDKLIGVNCPCFIIAEIGQNHQGDMEIAKMMIKEAKVNILLFNKLLLNDYSNFNIIVANWC